MHKKQIERNKKYLVISKTLSMVWSPTHNETQWNKVRFTFIIDNATS